MTALVTLAMKRNVAMTRKRPWTKTEVRKFIKDSRDALRLCEADLKRDDYENAYQNLYRMAGGAELLTDAYERWEMSDD